MPQVRAYPCNPLAALPPSTPCCGPSFPLAPGPGRWHARLLRASGRARSPTGSSPCWLNSVPVPCLVYALGCRPTVVVSSAAAAKDVLRGAASGRLRPPPPPADVAPPLPGQGRTSPWPPAAPAHTLARRLATMHLFTAKRMGTHGRGYATRKCVPLLRQWLRRLSAGFCLRGGLWPSVPTLARTSLNNILRMVCGRR